MWYNNLSRFERFHKNVKLVFVYYVLTVKYNIIEQSRKQKQTS